MSTSPDDRGERGSVRVVLDLDLTDGAPSGRLTREDGSGRAFFGWLQLMDGLEGARERLASVEPPAEAGGRREGDGH